jgi:hypothetical protein
MKLAQTLVLLLLPLPLLVWAVLSGHYRRSLVPLVAVAGIYVFTCVGAGRVIYDPALYTDAYFYTMVLVILGCYAAYGVILATGSSTQVDYVGISTERATGRTLILFTLLWTYSAAMLALYVSRHGAPPLIPILTGSGPVDVYAIRAEKTTSLREGSHWYVLGLQTVPYFTFIYAYALRTLERTRKTALLFAVSLVVTLGFATSFANKDVLLHLALYVILVQACLGRKGVRLRSALLYAALGLGSVFLFLRLYLMDRGALAVLSLFGRYLADRLLFVYAEAHALILQIFPQEHAFFYGQAFANPGGILPFVPVDLSQFLGYRVLGHLANYASPSFSHGYANFGVAGLLLILAIMTAELVVIQLVFRRLPRSLLFLSAYVLVAERMIRYGSESIQNVVAEEVVLFLVGVIVIHALLQDFSALTLPRAPRAEPSP